MKAKLSKVDNGWVLTVDNTIYATDENSKELVYKKLSTKNCQAIERGFDLDELAREFCHPGNGVRENFQPVFKGIFIQGFQKCLELIGDKKFSEEDMKKAFNKGAFYGSTKLGNTHYFDELIQSLQQTEWDVEIEMELNLNGKNAIERSEYVPKLDADGCLILKHVV